MTYTVNVKALGLALLSVLVVFCAVPRAGAWPDDLLGELIKRQMGMKSVHAKFVQEKHDPLLGRPIKSAGDFYFKPGKGVRWEYEDALVIYDGKALYVYSPETNEAEKIKGKKGFMGPLAFDVEELSKEYEMETAREKGGVRLSLKPKSEMPFTSMAMVFPGEEPFPSEVVVVQEAGDKAVIKFYNVRVNAEFSDGMFVFDLPRGAKINEREFE